MFRSFVLFSLVAGVGLLAGCGHEPQVVDKPEVKPVPKRTQPNFAPVGRDYATPSETVDAFLAALRSGDSPQVSHLLSSKARDEAAKHGFAIRSPGSARARYVVGEVVQIQDAEAGAGAHVHCTWTDYDEAGQEHAFEVAWILRREEEQWRIAGMSARLPGEVEPVVLNFEDLASMQVAKQSAESRLDRQATLNARAVPEGPAIDTIPR